MILDKNNHALAFIKWAKELLPAETYNEVNKKAAPASGGIAKKLNAIAKERLDKALLESPTNLKGLGNDSTLAVVRAKGKFAQEAANFQTQTDYGYETCSGCNFYIRDASGGPIGSCLVVEGAIPWAGTSDLYISSQSEAIHSFDAAHQADRLEDALEKTDESTIEKKKHKKPSMVASDENIEKKIKRVGGKFVVTSTDGTKELGTYDTKAEAVERLRQIEGNKKKSADVSFELEVEFAKTDDEKQIVVGVVLEPDEIDTQGDIITLDEIEKAAHEFLIKSRVVGKQHETVADAEIVESYLVPEDLTIGVEKVKKGTWVMAVKVHSDELWQEVKDGKFSGFSIGGKGKRLVEDEEEEEATTEE